MCEFRIGSGDIRHLGASFSPDGTLTIEGQDLGDGVEQIFGAGNREYERALTIEPRDVAQLKSALESDDSVLNALVERFFGRCLC